MKRLILLSGLALAAAGCTHEYTLDSPSSVYHSESTSSPFGVSTTDIVRPRRSWYDNCLASFTMQGAVTPEGKRACQRQLEWMTGGYYGYYP